MTEIVAGIATYNKEAVVIPTPRLVLRDFEPADWRRVFEYQSAPGYDRFHSWTDRSMQDVKLFVNRFVEWQKERPRTRFQLAIILRSEDKLIGNVGIRGNPTGLDAELGFELDTGYWHQGYAAEAARAMLAFAFDDLRMPIVKAHCIEENEASANVLERLNMARSRTEENAVWMKDRYWNTAHYSITADQWRTALRNSSPLLGKAGQPGTPLP